MLAVPILASLAIDKVLSDKLPKKNNSVMPHKQPIVTFPDSSDNQAIVPRRGGDIVKPASSLPNRAIVPTPPPNRSITERAVDTACKIVASSITVVPQVYSYELCQRAAGALLKNGVVPTVKTIGDFIRRSPQWARDTVSGIMPRGTRGASFGTNQTRKGRKNGNGAPKPTLGANAIPGGNRKVVTAPVAKSVKNRGRGGPYFRGGGKSLIVKHSEMIGSLVSSSTTLGYLADGYVVNPGKFSTFPWASTISSNFDKYRMVSLKFKLISNQPTTTAGKIGLGFDYDSTDVAPADRNEFFSLTHHTECSPWDSLELNIPVDNMYRFVNSHTSSDSKLIDVGQVFIIADQIVATSSNLADLIVEYEFELIEPQQAIYSTMFLTGSHPTSLSTLTVSGPVVANVTYTTSTTIFNFELPQGYYLFTGHIGDVNAGSPTLALAIPAALASGTYSSVASTSAVNYDAMIKVTGPGCQLQITFGGVAIANLEEIFFALSRISAATYANATLPGTFNP